MYYTPKTSALFTLKEKSLKKVSFVNIASEASIKGEFILVLFTKRDEIWQESAVECSNFGKSKQKQSGAKIQIPLF